MTKRLYCLSMGSFEAKRTREEGRRKSVEKGYEELVWAHNAREVRFTLDDAIYAYEKQGYLLADRNYNSAILVKQGEEV